MDRFYLILASVALVIMLSGCLENEEFPAYNVTKNYCGPEGLFGVPNTAPSGASFNSACYEHDKCYEQCKSNGKSQAVCDQDFRQTMDDSCDAKFNEKMTECDAQGGISSYVCEAGARLAASACWTQAATYHNGVAVGGKAVGSYPC
jgi:hypothetical protein